EVVLTGAPPGAEGEPGPAGAVTWLERSDDRLRLDVIADRPAHLVVADFYFPGWGATVDGADTPVLVADHAFRALAAPARRHALELRYRPETVRLRAPPTALAGPSARPRPGLCRRGAGPPPRPPRARGRAPAP